jgi:hypothetical protein
MRLVELLEYVQVVEAHMLGNPDMFNMKVSDSLKYMKRCNGHEDIEWQEASCHSNLAQANRIVRLFYHTKTLVFLIPKDNLCMCSFPVKFDFQSMATPKPS